MCKCRNTLKEIMQCVEFKIDLYIEFKIDFYSKFSFKYLILNHNIFELSMNYI